ncbi:SPOR domain-containing protein [Sphingomonas sp. URHD0057]|uniref:SPOR domain-containing protein n=1 Tax=Sphingomonas sp. URHD0057 TaxID=1380389 RepID=UPI00056D6B77|nr:SPOR domain-containing protein [Sphingomonas sp. URHD0057]
MTDSRAAVGFDRLPWLADEPERERRQRSGRELGGWAAAGVLLVAGASYWLGQRTAPELQPPVATRSVPQSTTVALPAPQVAQPQVEPDRVPQVEPAPVPALSVPRPTVERSTSRRRVTISPRRSAPFVRSEPKKESGTTPAVSKRAAAKPAATVEQPLRLWPARISQGASGRLVQIGAFGSRQQAKLGWRRMMRSYPAVGRLPATVVTARNTHGRYFYRFQIGTTSQAHSEVLCQRMEHIRFSCAVVGLPGARKAVER